MKTHAGFLILMLLVSTCLSYSQTKFGNATMDEMNMTVYPQDSTASAVILSKEGETRFIYNEVNGFQFEYTLKVRMKILKNEGLDLCNQSISYYQESRSTGEKIIGLSGTTYNLENGKIVKTKLSNDYIFDEDVENLWKVKKFSMPGAKVGSVIEYKYTITSIYLYELREFVFQASVPTLYTSYEIIIPEYYSYNVNMQGYERIATKRTPENVSFHVSYRDDNGSMRSDRVSVLAEKYYFSGQDIPAIKDEPFLWSLNDYITKVSFELRSIKYPWSTIKSLTASWSDVDKRLLDASSFGGNLKKSGLFKDEISNKGQTIERASEILDLVKAKVKWNEKSDLEPTNLKDALNKKIGNSADLNFLLINALKAGGFEAYPVVMSVRNKGRLPLANPSVSELNYTIAAVKIDTSLFYTDAAAKFGAWNVLPEKCMVQQARIIDAAYSGWNDLSSCSKSVYGMIATIGFTDDKMKMTVRDVMREEAALVFKNSYENYKDRNEYIEKLTSRLGGGEIEDFSINGIDTAGTDVRIAYTYLKDKQENGDMIYLNPLVEKLYTENPFKAETRKFPINFGSVTDYKQIISINVPDNYTVEEIPQSAKVVYGDNDLIFLYRVLASGNKIQLQYSLQINKLILLQDTYPDLQDFFAKIVQQSGNQIVLKKVAL
ncbi:MAG: DUF3857 domain-containing protein [Dysgonomonas sp.]|uniref:DUF3857 domain-containing protein n=1 Tax=Dysgonomonas sp. TaxID=1891233 RepID=UPI0039E31014